MCNVKDVKPESQVTQPTAHGVLAGTPEAVIHSTHSSVKPTPSRVASTEHVHTKTPTADL